MNKVILAAGLTIAMAVAGAANAQTPIKNPGGVSFVSVDHTAVTAYEVDIVKASDSSVVQTLTIPNTPLIVLVAGEVVLAINVMPVAFGQYRFVARAIAGTSKSNNSVPSAIWERAPGAPTGLVVK